MAAAVADFRPSDPATHKLKKTGGHPLTELELEPTTDILTMLAERRRDGQLLVGFAAEHGDGALEYGREKLERKGLDAIVINDISRGDIGFDSAENEVLILSRGGGEQQVARSAKEAVAAAVLDAVAAAARNCVRRELAGRGTTLSEAMEDLYELFSRGSALLADGHYHQATVPAEACARTLAREHLDPRGAGAGVVSDPALQ